MYVCNTKSNDVLNALKHMKDGMSPEEMDALRTRNNARELPVIIQVGMSRYRRLQKIRSQNAMKEEVKKQKIRHVINPNTLMLHKEGCYHIKEGFLKAGIINPNLTGLPLCGYCMTN